MPFLKEVVPQEFHDRAYLKPLLDKEQTPETFAEVFKKLDGAESLLGKRPGIPGKDAKDEEWDKFLSGLKPEKPEDYEIPVDKDAKPDEEFLKVVRGALLKGDINKRQASKFFSELLPQLKGYAEKQTAAQKADQEKTAAEFETLSKAALGEKNKVVMARVRKAIEDNAPAVLKPHVPKLDDNALVIMAGVIDAIMVKYMPEDEINPKGGSASGDDGKTLREQARALNEAISKMDPMDSKIDGMKAKLKQLYKEASAAGAK